jgi:hypothetical protein
VPEIRRTLFGVVVAGSVTALAIGTAVLGSLPFSTGAGAAPQAGPEKVWVLPSTSTTTVKDPGKILFTGSFADYGKSINATASGKPTKHGSYSLAVLQHGTILVSTSKFTKALDATQPQTVNQSSCSAEIHATAPITIVKGTKTYVGITGTFTVTVSAAFISKKTKSGSCTMKTTASSTLAGYFKLSGSGTVSFSS